MAKKVYHYLYDRRSTKTNNNRKIFIYVVLLILASLTINVFGIRAKPEVAGVKTEKVIKQNNFLLEESGSMEESQSSEWWLNSGGKVFIEGNSIKTIRGELPANDRWRIEYASTNPSDTDNGYHPQNIFRLVTRDKWQNFSQQVYFKINKDNLSKSINRGGWSGVFLFNRYQDGNNLYYTGVRVDGALVIKKKINGTYYTMAYKKVYPGIYNRNNKPSLLPHNSWLGLKSEVETSPSGSVSIKLYLDKDGTGNWDPVLEAVDRKETYGGNSIINPGFAGLRTDFMDVEFENYNIKKN